MAASDLLDAVSNAANLEYEPALFSSVSGQLVCDSDLAGGERVPDVGEVMCPSESSDLTDGYDGDDDESLTFGDSSCPSAQPFYFAKTPSKSYSKKFGSDVSRHDIAFVKGASDSYYYEKMSRVWWCLVSAGVCLLWWIGIWCDSTPNRPFGGST